MQPGTYNVVNAYAAGCLLVAIGMAGIIWGQSVIEKSAGALVILVGLKIIFDYFNKQMRAIDNYGGRPDQYR